MSETKKRPLPDNVLDGGPRIEQLWFETDVEKVFKDHAFNMKLWRSEAEIVRADWWVDQAKGKVVYRVCIDSQPYFMGDEPESITPRVDTLQKDSWEESLKQEKEGKHWQDRYELRLHRMTQLARELEKELRSLLPK